MKMYEVRWAAYKRFVPQYNNGVFLCEELDPKQGLSIFAWHVWAMGYWYRQNSILRTKR